MKKEENKQIIRDIENIRAKVNDVMDLNILQRDYIDFKVYDSKEGQEVDALLTINELLRTQDSHIVVNEVMTRLLKEIDKVLDDTINNYYGNKKED